MYLHEGQSTGKHGGVERPSPSLFLNGLMITTAVFLWNEIQR